MIFNLSASDAASVHAGQLVSISFGDQAQGEKLGSGTVTAVGVAIDTASRSVTVRASLSTPSRSLRIGQAVFGRISVGVHSRAVVVPSEALVPDGEGFKVFTVDSSGMAHEQKVKVGSRTEGRAEIIDGLKGGETVVTYGAYGIEDSTKIALPKS